MSEPRGPAFVVEGVRFPVSVAPSVPGDHMRYVRPPVNSLDWQGAVWADDALSFQTKVARAETMGVTVQIASTYEPDQDVEVAFMMLHDGVRKLARDMTRENKLADRNTRVRMTFRDNHAIFYVKVWPAIAGVTYYPEDDDTR